MTDADRRATDDPRRAALGVSAERVALLQKLLRLVRYKPGWEAWITGASEFDSLPAGWSRGQAMLEVLYPSCTGSSRPSAWGYTIDATHQAGLMDEEATSQEVAERLYSFVWAVVLEIEHDEYKRHARVGGRPSPAAMRLAADCDAALPPSVMDPDGWR